jgi:hypothetical protein
MADGHKDLKLAAPGAGLPLVERLVSRTALTIYAALATKEQVLQRFHREAEAAIALVQRDLRGPSPDRGVSQLCRVRPIAVHKSKVRFRGIAH